jgi:hypothetical protein
MFEEMEKAGENSDLLFAPQNHASVFLSFVWDATQGNGEGVEQG